MARKREKQNEGVLLVLLHAKERAAGLYPVLSRAVAAGGAVGGAWHGEESSSAKAKEQ